MKCEDLYRGIGGIDEKWLALADEPVKSLRGERGLMYLNEKAMPIDGLWSNGTASAAYWLWEKHGFSNCKTR
jgi:hypothetical protein